MAQTEVPVVLRVYAEKSSSVNAILDETKAQYGKLASSIESAGRSATLLAGSATVALGGLLAATVQVAGQFEQLQAKLESTLGSSEAAQRAFQNALQFAATTPFDVQSIVSATVTLEAFGQSAQRTLPIATNLAAAFGENIKDISLIVGKAFSGSLEGFEGLRNRLGIGNLLLQKYGAELTKTGGIAVTTSGQLEKARTALERIVQTRFGDATAKQSQTLFGAVSNLSDAVQRVAASFGQALIPVVTTAARFLTSVVEVFEKLDPGFKSFLVTAAAGGTVLLGLVTGIAALSTVVISGVGNLVAFAAALGAVGTASTAAAAGVSSLAATGGTATAAAAGFARIGAAVSGLGGALSGLAGGAVAALGPVGVLVALLGGAAFLALKVFNDNVAATEKALQEQARGLQSAKESLDIYLVALDKVTNAQGGLSRAAGDIGQLGEAVRQAFAGVSDTDFIARLGQAGLSLDDLQKAQQKNREEAKLLQEQIASVNLVLTKLQDGSVGFLSGAGTADAKNLEKVLGGLPVTVENVQASLSNLTERFSKLNAANLLIDQTTKRFSEVNTKLDETTKSAQSLQQYLQFAAKPDDIPALQSAFGVLNTKIKEVEGSLSGLGVPIGDTAKLQQRLLDGTDEEKRSVVALLQLYESRENLTKKISGLEDKQVKDRIQAVENQIERERVLGDVSLAEEKKRLTELLSIVKANSDEELALYRKIKQITHQEKQAALANARTSLGEVAGSAKDKLEELRASGNATSSDTVKAIQAILVQLDAWAVANKKLLDDNPELRKELQTTIRGFQKDLDSAKLQVPKERLDEALNQAKKFGAEATTNAEKLAAAQQALAFLTNVQASGQISSLKERQKLQEEITKLTADEAKLQKEITKEQRAQARETAGLKREGLQGELELLKAQQTLEGESAFRKQQIADLEKRILAEKIQAIREQEQAEIDAGASAEAAAERREIRITQVKNEETRKRLELEEAQTRKVDEEAKKQEDILNGFKQRRLGGINSPLISQEELNAQLSFLPSFSLDLNKPRSRGLGKPPGSLARVQGQVDADIKAGEKIRSGKPAGPGAASGPGAAVGAGLAEGASQTINQYNLGVQGYPIDSPEVQGAVRKIVDSYLADKKFQKGGG